MRAPPHTSTCPRRYLWSSVPGHWKWSIQRSGALVSGISATVGGPKGPFNRDFREGITLQQTSHAASAHKPDQMRHTGFAVLTCVHVQPQDSPGNGGQCRSGNPGCRQCGSVTACPSVRRTFLRKGQRQGEPSRFARGCGEHFRKQPVASTANGLFFYGHTQIWGHKG